MHYFNLDYRRLVLLLVCCVSLSACKEVLFSNLDEIEANEMVAALSVAGVDARRERDKDNVYAIRVARSDIPVATILLRTQGYPRPKFESLGDVFDSSGIVKTPFEQHIRYIHAMNEELSRTISAISGVKSARVFITSPPSERYARAAPPASASVSINFRPGFNVEAEVAKIKTLIAHSVPNLDYDAVAVALFLADGPAISAKTDSEPGPRTYEAGVVSGMRLDQSTSPLGWLLSVISVLSLSVASYLALRRHNLGFMHPFIKRKTAREHL